MMASELVNYITFLLLLVWTPTIQGAPSQITKIDQAVGLVTKNANWSVDPCDNFYSFACSRNSLSMDYTAQMMIETKSSNLLRDFKTYPSNTETLTNLRAFLTSCLRRDKQGLEPLIELLKSVGGFPLLSNVTNWEDRGDFDLAHIMVRFARMGLYHNQLINIEVVRDNADERETYIQIMPGISRKLVGSDASERIFSILQTLDPQITLSPDVADQIDEVMNLTQDLANSIVFSQCGAKAVALTMADLNLMYPQLRLPEILIKVFQQPMISDDEVIVKCRGYFEDLQRIIEYQHGNRRALFNLIFINLIDELGANMGSPLAPLVRSKVPKCMELTLNSFEYTFVSEYMRHFVDSKTINAVYDMFDSMKAQMAAMIQESDWISTKTRRRAYDKVNAIRAIIVAPDKLKDGNYTAGFFKGREMKEGDFIGNIMRTHQIYLELDKLRLMRENWLIDYDRVAGKLFEVNAYYYENDNSVIIPIGQIDSTIMSVDRPYSFNYGIVGMTIGHELSHSFDPDCVRYDETGQRACWWDSKSAKEYSRRTSCIEEQYDEVKTINGHNTLSENVADNAGYEIAYRTYLRWLETKGLEDSIVPGLEQFNGRQQFWISLANVWCGGIRGSSLHSPGKYRVLMPLRNIKEFAQDFSCPLGSPMNPAKKCRLWGPKNEGL